MEAADGDAELAAAIALSLGEAPTEADLAEGVGGASVAAVVPVGDESGGAAAEAEAVRLEFKWAKELVAVSVPEDAVVGTVKDRLEERTGVLRKRQKLVGVMHKGRIAADEVRLSEVKLGKKLMLIGTAEKNIIVEPDPEEMPDVFNDLDVLYDDSGKTARTAENLMLLSQRISTVSVTLVNEVRPSSKRLIVFDLDYVK